MPTRFERFMVFLKSPALPEVIHFTLDKMISISIITVVRNGADTIRDCIESVINQNYPLEYIIIDGCSNDHTLKIVKEYSQRITRIISEPDHGIYDAMNKGISLAKGDVIGILNSDDFYANHAVVQKVAQTFTAENVASCYGDLIYVDPVNIDRVIRFWRSDPFHHRRFYYGWVPPHPTFFVRRSVYEKYGSFNLNSGIAADYELMLRLLLKFKISTTYIPEVLVRMRIGGISNTSVKSRLENARSARLAWKLNDLNPLPLTLILRPLLKVRQYFNRC